MPTKRENAIRKIRKLIRELDTATTKRGIANREIEINRLQATYGITDDDLRIKGKYVVIDNVAVWKPGKWRI